MVANLPALVPVILTPSHSTALSCKVVTPSRCHYGKASDEATEAGRHDVMPQSLITAKWESEASKRALLTSSPGLSPAPQGSTSLEVT